MRARAARAEQSPPIEFFPSPRFWVERTRRRRARGAPVARSGWRAVGGSAASGDLALAGERKPRIVCEPEGYCDLALGARLRREALMHNAFEPRLLHPLRYCVGRKAEPSVSIFFTQEFELMRREVDDQQPTLRAQHPSRLPDGTAAIVEKMQHLVNDDDIEGIARYRKVENVALSNAAITDACVVEPTASESQHLVVEIDAETALDLGTEQFENAARPGAEIKQGTERAGKQQGPDLGLDRLIGSMKLADAVPLGCIAAEIVLCCLDSRGPHASEPLAVASNDRIGVVEPSD